MTQMVQALRGETPLEARAVLPVLRPALLGFMDGTVSTLAPLFAAAELGRSFLSALTGRAFLDNGRSPLPRASGGRRLLLVLGFVLPAILTPLTSVFAATLSTLDVEAHWAPPGFLIADLPRYLAQQMAQARLADWRFKPIVGHGGPPNRVEWSFNSDPSSGQPVFANRCALCHARTPGEKMIGPSLAGGPGARAAQYRREARWLYSREHSVYQSRQ